MKMKVIEIRSHAHSSTEDEKVGRRKQKAEKKGQEVEEKTKKAKSESGDRGSASGKSVADVAAEFKEFCMATREHLSIKRMREILETNGDDDAVVPRWSANHRVIQAIYR